jgi:hypothetical protein
VLIERGTKHKTLVYLLKDRWVVPNAMDMFESLEPRTNSDSGVWICVFVHKDSSSLHNTKKSQFVLRLDRRDAEY